MRIASGSVIGMPRVNEPDCPSPANVAAPPICSCCSDKRPAWTASTHQSAEDRAVGTKRPAIPSMESANSSKSRNTNRDIMPPWLRHPPRKRESRNVPRRRTRRQYALLLHGRPRPNAADHCAGGGGGFWEGFWEGTGFVAGESSYGCSNTTPGSDDCGVGSTGCTDGAGVAASEK